MLIENKLVLSPSREKLAQAYRMDEDECVNHLLDCIKLTAANNQNIEKRAHELVKQVRLDRTKSGYIDALMLEYDLSSEEGVALMCVAEALLRVPDSHTVDQLIQDKFSDTDWASHTGQSESLFVNATTWSMMLTGKVVSLTKKGTGNRLALGFKGLLKRASGPAIRTMIGRAMKIIGQQFVMGETIEEALKRARELEAKGYLYSYDMLGEAAFTEADAMKYLAAYEKAIVALGKQAKGKDLRNTAGICVKLSAIFARYQYTQRERVLNELVPRLTNLVILAKNENVSLTVDAEEAERLDLSLEILDKVSATKELKGWNGIGLAVQAYQKRALYVIDELAAIGKRDNRRWMVRLVKGAYWDSEIKLSQEQGYDGFPVFTRKVNTDVSYIACAQKLLENKDTIFPQFATHNAHTVATVLEMVGDETDFEMQCLHGMGRALYDQIVGPDKLNLTCRIYAPVGTHEDLLAYLVRRLLENGANSSFVNRIADDKVSIDKIIADPIEQAKSHNSKAHPKIATPPHLFGKARQNSPSADFSNPEVLNHAVAKFEEFKDKTWQAKPIIAGKELASKECNTIFEPANTSNEVGKVFNAESEHVQQALDMTHKSFAAWGQVSSDDRATILNNMADLLWENHCELMTVLVREAGKTIPDALAELREAIDFCRYYANEGKKYLGRIKTFKGPTGEENTMVHTGKGVTLCISPWNFPLAIFLGQVTAALVAGNTVIAKPAEQAPLIASLTVKLLYQAGLPNEVLALLPGDGATIGHALVKDERISTVMFTGSTETAKIINRNLAEREGPIATLIAETGGLNCMLVDSTALPEQVVADVLLSAFGSAGQRCSALRVLFLQDDVADKIITMLQGAMAELSVGTPTLLSTDVGPVIDEESKQMLLKHIEKMRREAKLLYQVKLPSQVAAGTFVPPTMFELDNLQQLPREVFGPVLHVIRYKAKDLDNIINQINDTRYGLTFGIHSRIQDKIAYVHSKMHVGNFYVNRNMIGAVVGVQPFGGEGLSGTGPKAGGPFYLSRLTTERTLTIDMTASGGNTTLLTLSDSDENDDKKQWLKHRNK